MPKRESTEKAIQAFKENPEKIVKIGWKGEEVFINTEELKDGDTRQITTESETPALPEFYKAMADVGKFSAKMMKFPADWTEGMKCQSVSINYEYKDDNKRMGLVVTLWVPLSNFSKGIVVNTPHMREKVAGASGGGDFIPSTLMDLLIELIDEAERYNSGERAQKSLLDKEEGEAESAAVH